MNSGNCWIQLGNGTGDLDRSCLGELREAEACWSWNETLGIHGEGVCDVTVSQETDGSLHCTWIVGQGRMQLEEVKEGLRLCEYAECGRAKL